MSDPLFKSVAEIEQWLREYMPGAVVEEDNDGQLVIYTNLYETDEFELAVYNEPTLF